MCTYLLNLAEGVRVELTRLLHSAVFKTAPVAGFRVDLPNLAVGEGLEPSCPFQDYSLAGCRFYHSPTLLTLVLARRLDGASKFGGCGWSRTNMLMPQGYNLLPHHSGTHPLTWCPRRDSNSHAFRQRLLRPPCLSIPPPGQRQTRMLFLLIHTVNRLLGTGYKTMSKDSLPILEY